MRMCWAMAIGTLSNRYGRLYAGGLCADRRFRIKIALGTIGFWISSLFCSLLLVYGLNPWLPLLMRDADYDLGSSLTFCLASVIGGIADKRCKKICVVTFCRGGG